MYVDDSPIREELMVGMSSKNEYIPKRQEILREYEIGIRFLSIGCVIRVGCKEIPFTDVDEAMTELSNYVSNPYEEGKKWQEIFKEQG